MTKGRVVMYEEYELVETIQLLTRLNKYEKEVVEL
jgi:hypothetical protein